jgi:hypothetical protein
VTDALPSRLSLVLDRPLDDLAVVLEAVRDAGGIDRIGPLAADPSTGREVHWGGRTQRAAVRCLVDDLDGAALVRVEAVIATDGWSAGLRRHAELVAAIATALPGRVACVRDGSARCDRPLTWLDRAVGGTLAPQDAIEVVVTGGDVRWLHTHGAARFGVPDLELYGLAPAQVDDGVAMVRRVLARLLEGGIGAALSEDGRPLRLVPVLRVWPHLPLEWPGIGRAGRDRGPGLDGPRATLSVLHPPRLGRHRLDVEGVLALLGPRDARGGRRPRWPRG